MTKPDVHLNLKKKKKRKTTKQIFSFSAKENANSYGHIVVVHFIFPWMIIILSL
jgi:hypothetical protein